MSNRRRLSVEREEAILEELKLRERLSVKAICRRHGVSARTLCRLREKLLNGEVERQMARNAPDTQDLTGFNSTHEVRNRNPP